MENGSVMYIKDKNMISTALVHVSYCEMVVGKALMIDDCAGVSVVLHKGATMSEF